MCGKTLVCSDTGKFGFICKCVYIIEELDIAKEFFISISADRREACPSITYSEKIEGMTFLEALEKSPESFRKIYIDVQKGIDMNVLTKVAEDLHVSAYRSQLVFLLKHLYDCYTQRDAELIEINPLVLTK